ncbi:diguanylate cyclase [Aliikangiella sp. IMCC44359]|uniref:diguanylate cyclase n=1 Tax=Aliikangiella sp. IMCC44359 TaxID=3459125 RepID=UPI00403AB670
MRNIKFLYWLSVIGTIALSTFSSSQIIALEKPKQLRAQFSQGDLAIEKIANQYGADFSETLNQLSKIEDQIYALGINDIAYFLTYRCYLQVFSGDAEGVTQTLNEYKHLKLENSSSRSIYASMDFCLAWQANHKKDYKTYDLYVEKAFQHALNSPSAVLRYWISFTFASLTNAIGRYNDSIEASQLALGIAIENGDDYREASVRSMLALSEAELGYYDDALKNNQLAIDWYESKNYQNAILELYQNRGYIYISKGELAVASKVFKHAIELAVKLNSQQSIFSMRTNLAAIAQRKGNYQESNRLALSSLKYAQEHKDENLVAHAHSLIAVNFLYLDKMEEAEHAFNTAKEYFERFELINNLADNYSGWSDALASKGDYERAYHAQMAYMQLSQKIYDSEREGKMQKFKSLHQLAEKDREIQRLQEKNRVQSVEVEKAQLEIRVYWLSGIIGFLIISLLILMYRRMVANNLTLQDRNARLDLQRFQDRLTKTFNRRYFEKHSVPLLKNDEGNSYTFFLLDIDHFKQVNDNWGHQIGDQVLVEFCKRLKSSIRSEDKLIRMGGEEFLIIIKSQSRNDDQLIAKKLLLSISELQFITSDGELSATMSVGLARTKPKRNEKTIENIIALADKALYYAKKNGRNQAVYCRDNFNLNSDFETLLNQPIDNIADVV